MVVINAIYYFNFNLFINKRYLVARRHMNAIVEEKQHFRPNNGIN